MLNSRTVVCGLFLCGVGTTNHLGANRERIAWSTTGRCGRQFNARAFPSIWDTKKEREEELRQRMLKKIAASKQQMETNRYMFMEDVVRSNVCYDDAGQLQRMDNEDKETKSDDLSITPSMEDEGEDDTAFARQVGLGTQAIAKINAEVEEEMLAEEEQKKEELKERGGDKNKVQDMMVDEARRRTGRVNSEQNTMDKAKDRAKVRNLEMPAGNIIHPRISDVSSAQLSLKELADKVGMKLGNNEVEIVETVTVIDKLEVARTALFNAKLDKSNLDLVHNKGKDKALVPDST